MPYRSVEDAIKKHPNLSRYSKKAQDAWVKAFNSAYAYKKDETYAFAVAWSSARNFDK